MSTLQNKIETINKELDIHKLMLGVWVIKDFTDIPSGDERITFPDYELYNYTITMLGTGGTIYGTTSQTMGLNIFTSMFYGAKPPTELPDAEKMFMSVFFLRTGEYATFNFGNMGLVQGKFAAFKVRKAPLDAYVKEMIESKWYKEQYLKGKTPTFKTEMSVYDYYVNNIMEK